MQGQLASYSEDLTTISRITTEDLQRHIITSLATFMPIVHNLEARDPYFIADIISKINLGTMPPFVLHNIDGTNNTRIVGFNYKNFAGELAIPQTLNGRLVAAIGNSAFANQTKITQITIPPGVSTIVDKAFTSCTNLTKVNISQAK